MEQKNEERGRQEGQIDRQKDCVAGRKHGAARGGGSQRGADASQWSEAGFGVFDDGRIGRERRAGGRIRACNRNGKSGFAEDRKRVLDQRPAGKAQKSLVRAHAAGLAAGEDKASGSAIGINERWVGFWVSHPFATRVSKGWGTRCLRRVRHRQRPTSSRKRISDSMPSAKFFRLNFSLGAWRLSSGRPKPIITLGRPR